MVECSKLDCIGKQKAKGLCHKHYKQTPQYQEKRREYDNRPEVKERQRELMKLHMKEDKYIQYKREYQRSDKYKLYLKSISDKRLITMTKHHEKYGRTFDLSSHEYKWALQSWGNAVKNRDNYKCVECKSNSDLKAHHILHKKDYPEFSLVKSNGMTLCQPCHVDIHRRDRIG
tara:strand:- start:68 stop:586 length:519 start_codon:yes stop_codon:yes gene_type:complete